MVYIVPAVDGNEGLGNRASSTQGKSVLISLAGCKDYVNTMFAYKYLNPFTARMSFENDQ